MMTSDHHIGRVRQLKLRQRRMGATIHEHDQHQVVQVDQKPEDVHMGPTGLVRVHVARIHTVVPLSVAVKLLLLCGNGELTQKTRHEVRKKTSEQAQQDRHGHRQ
jgi:hypothetical protein